MADKKKKVFTGKTFQETAAPRRPVILKSDRDATKEPKEKQEKEKQPTFILKTRENSATKDESSTSKEKTQPENEQQPCKIAQNEHKEKKIIETKPVPPLKHMTGPVKLLDEMLDFNPSALEFLHDSSTSYLVVGVLGTQGVGKSLIMNLIAHDKIDQSICTKILNSHELNPDMNTHVQELQNQLEKIDVSNNEVVKKENRMDSPFKFQIENMEHLEKGIHCTKGVDMYVTNDRIILLDCEAMFAPALIDESKVSPTTARSANVVTVDCLQVASFMIAICHVLIAVQDWFADYNFIRYIQAAEMLKPSLSASTLPQSNLDGTESTSNGENQPHLLLLHNRCTLEDFTVDMVKAMQDFYRKAFQRSNLQLNSGMYLYSDSNRNGLNVDRVCKNYSVDTCGTPLNLFLLPELYEDFDNNEIYRGHPTFEQLAKRLRWMIMGANRHQISNVPNLSEKGWFQYCSKAWDTIKKCTFFMEYERFLP